MEAVSKAPLTLASRPRMHTLTVRDARTQEIIDGTMFIVPHGDEKEDKKRRRDQH